MIQGHLHNTGHKIETESSVRLCLAEKQLLGRAKSFGWRNLRNGLKSQYELTKGSTKSLCNYQLPFVYSRCSPPLMLLIFEQCHHEQNRPYVAQDELRHVKIKSNKTILKLKTLLDFISVGIQNLVLLVFFIIYSVVLCFNSYHFFNQVLDSLVTAEIKVKKLLAKALTLLS